MSDYAEGLLLHEDSDRLLRSYLQDPSHAVLLGGRKGIGKSLVAQRIAANLLQIDPKTILTQPYIKVLTDEKGSISIEQVRDLQAFLARKVPGTEQVRRVVIIPDAELMTLPAQNAVLKMLEEPPVDTVFLLTSSNPDALLDTVRSRVQLLPIYDVTAEAITIFFGAQYGPVAVAKAIMTAGSDIARVRSLLSAEASTGTDLLQTIKQLLSSGPFEKLLLLEPFMKDKDAAKQLVHTMADVAQATLRASAAKQSTNHTIARWHHVMSVSHDAYQALGRNGNTKIVLTDMAVKL